jgi:integrase
VRLELALPSHMFEVARREWNMEDLVNPVKAIWKPKVPRGRARRLQAGEEARLLLASPPRLVPVVKLAIETGMRRSELAGLTWRDVDLDARVIHLEDTKNGDSRDVQLSSRALAVLEGLPRGGPTVFQVTPDWATKAFVKAARTAGLRNIRFHDLRHEATSRLFELGLNVVEASSITGHKSLQMLKRYTHLKAADLVVKLG